MKIRIQDSSIRYRVTLREVEDLGAHGNLVAQCLAPDGGVWRYGIRVSPNATESHLAFEPFGIILELAPADFAELQQPKREGVYIRREWTAPDGTTHRMIAFVEKDRPASVCDKPEMWIYEGHGRTPQVTVPIHPNGQ